MATALVKAEREYIASTLNKPEHSNIARAANTYLDYLDEYWLTWPLWSCWSDFGRLAAASRLKIPVEGVVPTTNHLESFNAILKKRLLPAWLHSGHRLHFDSLIYILITQILPNIYTYRRSRQQYSSWLQQRFKAISSDPHRSNPNGMCWWPVDKERDQRAQEVIRSGQLIPFQDNDPSSNHFEVICSSASTYGVQYKLEIVGNGHASCSCPDYNRQNSACKHL
jgi:hypothetical protein